MTTRDIPGDSGDWAQAQEAKVLEEALRLAPVHGWTWPMTKAAGAATGLSEGETELLLPKGPRDLAALACRHHDADALAQLASIDPETLKIRQRIARAVEIRIDAAMAHEAAERRLAGFLALPQNLVLAGRLAWESADHLWRWAGDVAVDENHYSKRAILAGVLTGAPAIRLTSGREEAQAFVARRIDNVMAYEKWKATTSFRPADMLAGLAGALGRIRYSSRP